MTFSSVLSGITNINSGFPSYIIKKIGMAAFMTHPSVRIKGTENNYEPMLCVHPKCAERPPHMHCPFCVKTEIYPDPVILKAHYRVKHVDKGLDFAGLKILRCCDHCDIVGTIKGEKKFKGPHWHCYKCRNGFNRRDEAIKHYRTHFRNPQTTFQIQVAQEVNIMLNNLNNSENAEAVESIGDHNDFSIHGSLAESYYTTDAYNNHKNDSAAQVAANETVDASDAQTIMIIQDRESQDDYKDSMLIQSEQQSYEELLQQKCDLERHVENLEANLKVLESTKNENERLKQLNRVLVQQVDDLKEELASLKEFSGDRHADKINQLIDKLTNDLQNNAKNILLEQVKRLKVETHQLFTTESARHLETAVQTDDLSLDLDSVKSSTCNNTDSTLTEPKPKRTRTARL